LGNLFVGSLITSNPATLILSAVPSATVPAARFNPLALGKAKPEKVRNFLRSTVQEVAQLLKVENRLFRASLVASQQTF
jgi:hypothetical protein